MDQSRSNLQIIASAILLTVVISSVSARTFTKAYLIRNVEVEDYVLVISALGFAIMAGLIMVTARTNSWHESEMPMATLRRFLMLANYLIILYASTMLTAKIAILLQIKRLFTAHQRDFVYWSVNVLIAAHIVGYLVNVFGDIFACSPRKKIWEPNVPGTCLHMDMAWIITGFLNLMSDITILCLPAIVIARLRIQISQKLGAMAIFSTGVFACFACAIRVIYGFRALKTSDRPWEAGMLIIWSAVEAATAIFVACFPTFPKLYKFIRDRSSKSSQHQIKDDEAEEGQQYN